MIAELKPSKVAIVPADSEHTLAIGGDSVFGPSAEFAIDMTEATPARDGLTATLSVREPIGSDFLNDIAQATLKRALRLNSAGAWTQAGFAFLAAQDTTGARRAFETALSRDSAADNAKLGLARAAHQEGHSDEAVTILKTLLVTSSRALDARVSLAVVYVGLGRFRDALALLNEPADFSKAATLLAARGGVEFMQNNINAAVSDLRKAVRLKPEWVHARNTLGLAELKAGHRTAAERHFRAAVRIGPMNVGAVLNLVRLLREDQRWEEVLSAIERYWKPGAVPIDLGLRAAEACFALYDPRSAKAWLESMRGQGRTPEENGVILNNLGVAYTDLNLFKDAQKAFEESVETSPDETSVANLGKVLLESGNPTGAVELLEAWRGRPEFKGFDLGLTLALALMHAHRNDEAIHLAASLVARPEANERAFALLSALQADGSTDYQEAAATALAGLKKWPSSSVLKNNLSYALLMNGQAEEAAKVLPLIDESSLRGDDRVYVAATKGLLALWQGDLVVGRRLYEMALGLAGKEFLRERVKAKRDLEVARAMLRLGKGTSEAIALLKRAASGQSTAEPYVSHAQKELRLLTKGDT